MKLKDRVAIITGGGRGIGRAYVLGFAREGAKVVIGDINGDNAQAVAKEVEEMGGEALSIKCDISSEDDTMEMARKAIQKFGKIDILLNNAAYMAELSNKPFDTFSIEEWDTCHAVNVRGTWLCIKAVVPHFKSQRKGKIINISSIAWLLGIPLLLNYLSSKAAVVGLTYCLAKELGRFNINVNCLMPGITMTEGFKAMRDHPPGLIEAVISQVSLGRIGTPEDMVGPAIFLASEDSDFVSGQCIAVDGGMVVH